MSQSDRNLTLIQQLVIDLSLIDRHHYLAKTDRRENDIEHSMSVVVLSWYFHEKVGSPLDLSKILQYAVAHDFVERYAGDVNTFASDEARTQKAKDESESLAKLSEEFRGFGSLVDIIMHGYETRTDEESLFVWTVDKMQALIMGDMDDWRPYSELSISYVKFCEKYAELLSQASPYCRDIFSELVEYSKSTYYDQPA